MLDAYVAWGNDAVAWVQSFRAPALDSFFEMATLLGDSTLLLALIAAAFWCVDRRLGLSLALVFLLSAYVNMHLKELLAVPRPGGLGLEGLDDYEGYSLPSGHAQTAATVWAYWGLWFRRRWAWGAAALVVGLVSLGRVYTGAHYPGDVVGGVVVGLLMVALFAWGQRVVGRRLAALPVGGQLALAAGTTLLLTLGAPSDRAAVAAAALLGAVSGWVLEERYLRVAVAGSWPQYGARLLLGGGGLAVIALLQQELGGVRGGELLAAVALGGWITAGAPALFVRLGMMERQASEGVRPSPGTSPATD